MIGRAAALTNLGDKDRAFRAKKQAFGSFFRFSPCRCALMRRKLRQRQIPSFGRRMVRVCRETDFSGCYFARKYNCMGMPGKASLCHPCRQPSAPACGVPRRRNGSRAQRRQREVRRECRNEDFSGCYFARKYNCMGTPKKASLCQREVWRECRNEDFSGCYFARKYNCMGTPEKSHCSRILFSKKRR